MFGEYSEDIGATQNAVGDEPTPDEGAQALRAVACGGPPQPQYKEDTITLYLKKSQSRLYLNSSREKGRVKCNSL